MPRPPPASPSPHPRPPPPAPAVFGTSAPDRAYMPRVQGNTAGVLHDHLGLWKVSSSQAGYCMTTWACGR